MPISISNLFKQFPEEPKKALVDITHSFPSEDMTVVIGTNGSGKSTLLNCVVGLLPFERGRIEVELQRVKYELRTDNPLEIPPDMRKHIGYIFQQKALWQHLTVLENLVHPLLRVHKLSNKEALLRAQNYLELIELKKDYYNKFPHELSGGEQRKVAIARTLAIEPELLLIDELEANLDQTARQLTLKIIQEKFISEGKTILIVSHSIDLLEQFTPHILVLHDGQVVESAKGISELLLKNHLSSSTTKIIKESVDSSSSRWFLANQSLQAAIKISEINVTEKDLSKILTEIGKEISQLITRFDPEGEHLLMIATKTGDDSHSSAVQIRCAEKTDKFILDGSEVRKLSKIITGNVFDEKTGRVTYQFKPDYRDDFLTDQGITLERKRDFAEPIHDSLIDMMFDTNGLGLYYQLTSRHPQIFGAKNISVPIPPDHVIENLSYYEFSGRTRNVYLIGCTVGDKVKGIISIDTYSKEKWSNFIVQQLILVGNMVAIAIKNHESDAKINKVADADARPAEAADPIVKKTISPLFPKGFFSEIDRIHIHVDGGVAANLVENVVKLLNDKGHPSKLTSIQDAIAGPQRKDLSKTYKSHTPGSDDQEKLEYFSTTRFNNLDEAKQQLRWLLGELRTEYGIVIEAEQVIGKIGQELSWSKMSPREVPIIQSAEVGFDRSNTLPVEIHYGCDIPKERDWATTAPLRLETLLEVCAELEIRVGGWFLFEEDNDWCYRANMFERDVLPQRVKKQRDDLAEHLNRIGDELGFDCKVTALVERSLGVWKTPLTPWTPPIAQRKP
jgi:ABC-type polar amino acid transport system ATPase subunit